MSVKNGFTYLWSIIIGLILIAIYWLSFSHWHTHYRASDITLFTIFGIVVIADCIWIGTMSSPILKNSLFWIAILIWIALFVWMGATGAQGMVDPASWLK